MTILEARSLCKHYSAGSGGFVQALEAVSLCIPAGGLVVTTGPSGSGKSTLLALLGALERPTGGQVLFHEEDLSRCSDVELARVRRRMGFVFQDFGLIPNLPVWENITYPLIPRGLSYRQRLRIARALLQRFGLEDRSGQPAGELSGGEQQRVALARAVAGEPEVLLADEPTSNLDPANRETVFGLVRELHDAGTTVVIASHDPDLLRLATCLFRLEAGRLKPVR
jgi:putative ABC transport system ATP-binding protein